MSDKNNEAWAIKRAIYDMMDRNLLEVPNKKTMMNFIKDNISNDDLFTLCSLLEIEDNKLSVDFLTECYFNNLKQNSDLPIFNEREILNQRDSVLTESDGESEKIPLTAKDIHLMIKKYGTLAVAGFLAKKYFSGNKAQRKEVLKIIASLDHSYDKTIKASFFKKIAPKSRTFRKTSKDIWKNPWTGTGKALKTAKITTKKAIKDTISQIPPRVKKRGKISLIVTGVVGAMTGAYFAYKYYMDTKNARSACQKFKGKQKDICILKYQIAASETALSVLQNSKSKCSQSNNPEKCIYGINQAIWKWQQRKVKYLAKLSKLSGKPTEEVSKKVPKKESPF